MDEAGIYAWIVILLFFAVFAFLQIRNCIRDVRGNITGSFADLHPSIGIDSAQQHSSSVYTIDMNGTNQQTNARPAYSNQGYLTTENAQKENNDGLPSYEEAIGKVSYPVLPAQDMTENTQTEAVDGQDRDRNSSSRPAHVSRRHRRHHRRHFQRMDASPHNSIDEADANDDTTGERRRHRRHGRGHRLGRKLAKLNQKRNRSHDPQP